MSDPHVDPGAVRSRVHARQVRGSTTPGRLEPIPGKMSDTLDAPHRFSRISASTWR
jgi:hypothetical protein